MRIGLSSLIAVKLRLAAQMLNRLVVLLVLFIALPDASDRDFGSQRLVYRIHRVLVLGHIVFVGEVSSLAMDVSHEVLGDLLYLELVVGDNHQVFNHRFKVIIILLHIFNGETFAQFQY